MSKRQRKMEACFGIEQDALHQAVCLTLDGKRQQRRFPPATRGAAVSIASFQGRRSLNETGATGPKCFISFLISDETSSAANSKQ